MLNKIIAHILPYMPKKLVWIFSQRYIAGETIEDGLQAARELNQQGIEVTIDLLGEFITSLSQAEENKNKYLEIIERFTEEKIRGNFSLKPTMFGLLLDRDVCYAHLREIAAKAVEKNNFVRIDMEDSKCVDPELTLFKSLKAEFSGHVGLVLQAYLHRTIKDLVYFSQMPSNGHPLNFRLCKGIYIEPAEIAYKGHEVVREHYLEDLEFMLKNKMYAAIATHDKYLVDGALKLIEKYQVPKSMYEFQMLFGVTPELRNSIVNEGHKMRVYVPFGQEWFNYSTRRLKENPQVAGHIIKALFFRG